MIQIVLALLIFSVSASAAPMARHHQIELKGKVAENSPHSLSVKKILVDFPRIETVSTKWREDGPIYLQGISLKNFVAKYGAPGVTKVRITAINEYSQTLTSRDWDDWNAFLAFQESNGNPISTRNRGTFRIIYDYEKYESDMQVINIIEANSIWQITRVEFLK